MTGTEKMYTTQEAAKELGMSDSNLRNMIRWGKAKPVQKFGNVYMFSIDEIERLRNRKRWGPKTK